MRIRKLWALAFALALVVAALAGWMLTGAEPGPALVTSSAGAAAPCASVQPPSSDAGPAPSVAQPGGIDPLGASRAIRSALGDCP
jgi:hypothetical protein